MILSLDVDIGLVLMTKCGGERECSLFDDIRLGKEMVCAEHLRDVDGMGTLLVGLVV